MPEIKKLELGKIYHIYNRGINGENLFREERNYAHFLQLYYRHLFPKAETYAYCLLKNHFHLLIYLKTDEEIVRDIKPDRSDNGLPTRISSDLSGLGHVEHLLTRPPSQAFSNLFNAYTKSFNIAYDRTGALFERPFRRIEVHTPAYFHKLVIYIHQNPQQHGFVDDFRDWKYSSYRALVSDKETRLSRSKLLKQFDGVAGFLELHNALIDLDFE